ncbi:T9SS type A sorting domain-containing protein [Chryseolinea serpens]|nr:T9SS type A sorting domain-containing protein [Chryseolinea serpens]
MPLDNPPAKPTQVTISSHSKSNTLQWQANSEADIKGYAVYRGTTNDPSNATLLGTTATTTLIDTDALTGEGFYWVKAYDNNDHYSAFSDMVSVVITATEVAEVVRFLVYPNPVSDFLKLEWDHAAAAEYIFYDVNGKPVKQGTMAPGELIDVRDLAPGHYECGIVTNHKSTIVSIIKQ